MTRFIKEDIPVDITTIEQLAAWCGEILSNLYPNDTVVEAIDDGGEQIKLRVAESNKFYLTAPDTPHWRHIMRLSFELFPEHQITGKLWKHTKILGDKLLPAGFKS